MATGTNNVLWKLSASGNLVSMLSAAATGFAGVNASAKTLTKNLNAMRVAAGAVSFVVGAAMLKGIAGLSQASEGYLEQLTQAKNMGLSNLEIAKLEMAARQTSAKVMTTTMEQNLRAGRELLMVFNKQEDAFRYLPKLQAMASNIFVGSKAAGNPMSMDKATDQTYEAARALDLWNYTQKPDQAMRILDGMQKAATAYGYKVKPQDFYMAAKYMKGVVPGEEFITKRLPVLISDLGASTAGVAVNQMNRVLVAGRADHKTAEALVARGVVAQDGIVYNKAGQVKGIKAGGLVNAELAAVDQYAWFQKEYVPRMLKQIGVSFEDLYNQSPEAVAKATQAINQDFGGNRNQLQAARMYVMQMAKFDRDARNMSRAKSIDGQTIENMKASPAFAREAVSAQWKNVKTALGTAIQPVVQQAMVNIAIGLNKLAMVIQAHPNITKAIMMIAGAVGIFLTVAGVVLTIVGVVAGVAAIIGGAPVAIILGVIAGISAIVAAAFAVDWSKLWQSIKAAASAVRKAVFGFVATLVKSYVQFHAAVIKWGVDLWTAFFNGMKGLIPRIIDWFRGLPGAIWNGIKGLGAGVPTTAAPPPTAAPTSPAPTRSGGNTTVVFKADGREIARGVIDQHGRAVQRSVQGTSGQSGGYVAHSD